MDSNHNLLSGLIALEKDFVARDEFFAALRVWKTNPDRRLDEILLERKALSSENAAAVRQLMAEFLETPADETPQSPATMDTWQTIRETAEKTVEVNVQSAAELPAATPVAEDPFATHKVTVTVAKDLPTTPGNAAPSGGNRFRIVRPHARGGLGEVFVADDQELHREVALKEIQSRHADHPDSRARFLLEAEITGGLEHPGIVPVYGLGRYADGRPYYAMRFIRGDSLKEAIEKFHATHGDNHDPGQRLLELRQLLGRFIDVCNAMEYSHSRGVLHRDIKPGNIMLGKYGETLVVDWGLAKPLGRPDLPSSGGERQLHPTSATGTAPTAMGSAVGTPQYMSPEQAAGKLDEAGPPSDVYSLGATLYTILTGKAAFEGSDLGTILQNVKKGIFPRPREISKYIPAPLEAICLKAMATNPDDRYPTPLPLAADLENWMADEAVSAYREPWLERATRWVRRHKTWAQASAAAVLLIAIISIAASVLINNARKLESVARRDAEESYLHARRTVDEFFTRVSENKLLNVPGLQPLRRELLEGALQHYQNFNEKYQNDPGLQAELAVSQYRTALIVSELGKKSEALDNLKRAREIQMKLRDEGDTSDELTMALANSLNAMGDISQELADLDQAEEYLRESLQLRSGLADQYPDRKDYQRKAANARNNLAVVHSFTGQMALARKELDAAIATREQLVNRYPDDLQLARDLAQGYYNLGLILRDHGELSEALEPLHKAVDCYRNLVARDEKTIESRRELARALLDCGRCHEDLGERDAAQAALDEALTCAEKLARQNPYLLELRADAASIMFTLGLLKEESQQHELALAEFTRARNIREQLVAEDPDSLRFQFDLASCDVRLGMSQLATNALDDARVNFSRALDIYQALAEKTPDDIAIQDGIAQVHRNIGLIERASGKLAEAVIEFEETVRIYERLAALPGSGPAIEFGLADALLNIAVDEWDQGHVEPALQVLERATKIQADVIRDEPDNLRYQYLMAEIAFKNGSAKRDTDDVPGAIEGFELAVSVLTRLVGLQPGNLKFQSLLGITCDKLAIVLWMKGDSQEQALQQWELATEHLRLAFDGDNDVIQYRINLDENYRNRSLVFRKLGRWRDAADFVELNATLWPADPYGLIDLGKVLVEISQEIDQASNAGSPVDVELLNEIAGRAVALFRKALDAGYPELDALNNEEMPALIRDREDFKSLFTPQ